MNKLSYDNIFDSFVDDPKKASEMRFRADLAIVLRDLFEAYGMSQAEIGQTLSIQQPRVSELMTGKLHKFSSEKLISYLATIGLVLELSVSINKMGSNRGKPEAQVKCEVLGEPNLIVGKKLACA